MRPRGLLRVPCHSPLADWRQLERAGGGPRGRPSSDRVAIFPSINLLHLLLLLLPRLLWLLK
eukprot:7051791-Lingulodinium_polyedra.AAC.1